MYPTERKSNYERCFKNDIAAAFNRGYNSGCHLWSYNCRIINKNSMESHVSYSNRADVPEISMLKLIINHLVSNNYALRQNGLREVV